MLKFYTRLEACYILCFFILILLNKPVFTSILYFFIQIKLIKSELLNLLGLLAKNKRL